MLLLKKIKGKEILENIKLCISAAFDVKELSSNRMRKSAMDELDNFMLLCYGDIIGIPLPTSYYTLELLPYLAEDLIGWEHRIMARRSVLLDRWGDFDN